MTIPIDDRALLLVLMERVARRSHVTGSGCWQFDGAIKDNGYGVAGYRRGNAAMTFLVHRLAHVVFLDDIPDGLQVDHLCRNRACWNPLHLQAVTHRINSLRGEAPRVRAWRTGKCLKGHDLNANAYVWNGKRQCSECARTTARRRYAAKRKAMDS